MGNVFSSDSARVDVIGESEREISNMASTSEDSSESQEFHDAIDEIDDREERIKAKEAEMEEFRRQLQIKREQRRGILDRHKSEKKELELCLDKERKAKLEAYESNKSLRELLIQNNIEIPENLQSSKENSNITDSIVNMQEEFEKLKSNNNKLRRDLADSNVALKGAYSDIADLHLQNTESIKQINALKEVVAVSKTMLGLRENQLDELKAKLSEIERSLADREANMLSADLRQEYERQLQNIRSLRTLYEERARLAEVTRQGLIRELEEQKALKQAEINKVKDLTSKVQELEARVDELQEMISNKNNQIYTCQGETRGLKAEMSAVNKLFSQVLLGYKNQQDLDKLVHRLEENHGILTHMAGNENDSEASSALPKLLLEIVSQVDEGEENVKNIADNVAEEATGEEKADTGKTESVNLVNTTAEEIVQNLPKVWRVLIELLSHQATPDDDEVEKVTTCYKTVETKTGPVQVPSVSQTYIRLKDLIVEKLGLVKEVNRMKQLNVHLETRLEEQERRLCLVTNELSKTWHVVGRLRRHHHQLHTHEKILKYELQQKRTLLNELKEELEYCREKWDQAREKNTQSEKDWKKLRAEFSSRNTKSSTSFNNSAESGYSDEKPSDESSESNDESEYVTEPLIRCKKKLKKSFETILDSSTDRNLAAEREDPASDMIDVADLPLDTQDSEDHHDVSDSCNSESLLKSDKVCETEDEVGDITHDSCTEDLSAADLIQVKSTKNSTTDSQSNTTETQATVPIIDPATILRSISEQNERLANKDKKLERLEKSGAALLQKTQSTVKISNDINDTLDHILNRPSSSKLIQQETQEGSEKYQLQDEDKQKELNMPDVVEDLPTTSNITEETVENHDPIPAKKTSIINTAKAENIIDKDQVTEISIKESPCSSNTIIVPTVDFKAILENIKKQNETLARKDERLERLESGCSEIVNNISNTLSTGDELIEKLDNLHNSSFQKPLTSNLSLKNVCNETLNKIHSIDNVDSIPSTNRSNTTKEDSINSLKDHLEDHIKNKNNTILDEPSTSNFNTITGIVKKDKNHENLETTLNKDKQLVDKMDCFSDGNSIHDDKADDTTKESSNSSNRDSSEPSTSSEVDHEALFAARDLRLKRLEEQTKSLVNKVNKTTDKGVKIHYKLEELHNIYGSESSRAGTPSDNEERDRVNDDKDKASDEKSRDDGGSNVD